MYLLSEFTATEEKVNDKAIKWFNLLHMIPYNCMAPVLGVRYAISIIITKTIITQTWVECCLFTSFSAFFLVMSSNSICLTFLQLLCDTDFLFWAMFSSYICWGEIQCSFFAFSVSFSVSMSLATKCSFFLWFCHYFRFLLKGLQKHEYCLCFPANIAIRDCCFYISKADIVHTYWKVIESRILRRVQRTNVSA